MFGMKVELARAELPTRVTALLRVAQRLGLSEELAAEVLAIVAEEMQLQKRKGELFAAAAEVQRL